MRGLALGLLLVACFAVTAAWAECEYDLSAFDAGCTQAGSVTPRRLNDDGWVIGTYYSCGTISQRGYLWTPKDGFRDLPPPPGFNRSTPWSISNSGVVVGYVRTTEGPTRGCVWIDTVPTLLPEVPWVPNDGSKAVVMLSDGSIYGQSGGYLESVQCIAWTDEGFVDMPTELLLRGTAEDWFRNASSNDWICGVQVLGPVPGDRLFRMRGDFWESVLGPDDDAIMGVQDINRSGVMVGSFAISTDRDPLVEEAWSFRFDGAVHPLEGLTGYSGAQPTGMNDVGTVVGRTYCVQGSCSPLPSATPVLWRGDTPQKIWELLPAFNGAVWEVYDINNRGQLLLYGGIFDSPSSSYSVIIATPKDVPDGDISIDCVVNADDLVLLLGSWGPREDAPVREADLDGDGEIGPLDLAILLGAWSPG